LSKTFKIKIHQGDYMDNKHKLDDRRDNVEKIQYNINHTLSNYRETEELINKIDDENERKDLEEKNRRREQSLSNMRSEIQDEAKAKERDYK